MKDKSVIIVTNSVQSKGPVPSGLMLEGSGHLAGKLYQEGYQPLVLDFNNVNSVKKIAEEGKEGYVQSTIEEIHQHVQKTEAKLVGFTLYTNGFRDNVRIAKELKKRNPGLMIAAGGPSVSWFREDIFSYTDVFDVLVQGKTHNAFVKLAECAYENRSFSEVPSAIYMTNNGPVRNSREKMDFADSALPCYDSDVYLNIDKKVHVHTVTTTIGCRYGKCTFCIQPRIDGKYVERDIENVLNEIDFVKSVYGITNLRLSDSNPSPKQLKNLFSNLPKEIKIASFAYSDHKYDFSKAKENLISLFIGVESFNPNALRSIKKTKNVQEYVKQCQEMIQEAKKQGVAIVYANIVPFANDTSARIEEDLENVIRMDPDVITALPLAPMPYTPLYFQILREGDKSGLRLNSDYIKKFMLTELDLLQPPSKWPDPPFQLKVDGQFVKNPFQITGQKFVGPLAQEGIGMASDEIVLMAHLYNNGLSKDQEKKRVQINNFQKEIRECLLKQDYKTLEEMIIKINN